MEHPKSIVQQLTLEEKASLCSGKDYWHLQGIERLDLPSIMLTDGPHGLRKQLDEADIVGLANSVKATCYPTAVTLASSWDEELIHQVGVQLGEECVKENVSVLLGPGANIKRSPLCGRNFEYFSEDPFLSGHLAKSLISGIQSKGIGTSLKHFVANNQESMRMAVDTFVDERTLREIYLKGFEIAVKEAQPWTVMCSYNKLNETYLSENKRMLTDILKEEWGHKGLVVTDWGACNNRVDGLLAGQELEMPGNKGMHDSQIIKAVKNGTLPESILDERVERVVDLILKSTKTLNEKEADCDLDKHHQFARKVASEGIVLLKNENQILPLKKDNTVALIGHFATKPRYQGSGSSLINPTKILTAKDAFEDVLGNKVTYAQGYNNKKDEVNIELVNEAITISQHAEYVVLMIGLTDDFESEGFDRKHLSIPNSHIHLLEELYNVNKNIIVALSNGSPVSMPWIGKATAVIEQYLGGQASGGALADVVFGDVNPSGKLAETFPNNLDEFPVSSNFPGLPRQVEYREGLYVGYRYYDSASVTPLFPFGFGLSYTTFEYSNLTVNQSNQEISLEFDVMNTGKIDGKEIVQVYVNKSESVVYRPEKELKAFKKVFVKSGGTIHVNFSIPIEDLGIYQDGFKVEDGTYNLLVGRSSRDIVLRETIKVKSNDVIILDNQTKYHRIDNTFNPSKNDFEQLYGKEIPAYPAKKPFHMNSVIYEIKDTLIGKIVQKAINKQFIEMMGAGENDQNDSTRLMVESMVSELPIRNLAAMSNGMFSEKKAIGLLYLLNKKPIRGIYHFLKR